MTIESVNETSTRESNSVFSLPLQALLEETRQAFGRVVYSHKAHEKCADHKLAHFNSIRILQTALSAIASTGFIAIIFGKPEFHQISAIVGGTIALFLTGVNLYSQGRNLTGEVDKHTVTASKLWLVRERYLSLITDIFSQTITVDQAKQIRQALQTELAEIYSSAPRTDYKAYKAAQVGLKDNEEYTFSDKEIDIFLPLVLRKGGE